ncbi:hypothetical protein [Chondromyces apiculatus]|uniref:hypothetical protein n=1 Tax=Chondromyces apiculatus TaxID=51 RepID=UPI0018CC73D7|nr:hypothetical protein [Chondromyces apiculatus]
MRITLVDAKIGPGKIDASGETGTQWDSPIPLPVETIQNLIRSLSIVDKRAAIAAGGISVLSLGMDRFTPPDPVGYAEVVNGGEFIGPPRIELTSQEDTFSPLWNGPPSWLRVSFQPELRVFGAILDNDSPFDSEKIGAFQISYDVLVAALRSGKVHQVQVADQTHNQLLFLGIQVWPVP